MVVINLVTSHDLRESWLLLVVRLVSSSPTSDLAVGDLALGNNDEQGKVSVGVTIRVDGVQKLGLMFCIPANQTFGGGLSARRSARSLVDVVASGSANRCATFLPTLHRCLTKSTANHIAVLSVCR